MDPFQPGLLSRLPEWPQKVVLVRASRIGDFICATPTFRALRAALPEAELTMITLPILRDLVLRSPHLDRFVAFPGFPGIAEQFFDARRMLAFLQAMQAEQFDLAVQMQGSGVYSNPFTLLLGAQATAGFVRSDDWDNRLDGALALPAGGHEVQRLLALSCFLGAPDQGEATEFPLWPADHEAAQQLLRAHGPPEEYLPSPLIGLQPGARDVARRWPPERFAEAAQALQDRYGGTILVFGEAEDRPLAEEIVQSLCGPFMNLAGQTSLPVMGAVMTRLALFVTNDTGPAHIAYALGVPTVTIFGGEEPARYGPLQNGPFRLIFPPAGRAHEERLEGVSVPDVLAAADELLALTSH